MNMNIYGRTFYDLDVTVTRLACLALLVNGDPMATTPLEEMTEELEFSEYAALFGLDEKELEEKDMQISNELTIEMCQGWLVSALVMIPRNIKFMEDDGRVRGYSSSNRFRTLLVYADTLDLALDGIIQKAELERHDIFNQARKKLGFPEHPLEKLMRW